MLQDTLRCILSLRFATTLLSDHQGYHVLFPGHIHDPRFSYLTYIESMPADSEVRLISEADREYLDATNAALAALDAFCASGHVDDMLKAATAGARRASARVRAIQEHNLIRGTASPTI